MTRRERREQEAAERTAGALFRRSERTRTRRSETGSAARTGQAFGTRTKKVGAGAVTYRGSDGSLVRSLRRRRLATVSAMASVSVAGSAVAAILLVGNAGNAEQVAAGSEVDATTTSIVGAEDVSTNVRTGDAESGSQNFSGVPSARDRSAEAASRSVTRTALPGCSGEAPRGEYSNGQLPEQNLCDVGIGKHQLRADAAVAFAEMNAAFKAETGKDMAITDSYRTLESQISVAGRKPGLAAQPGTSLHGWGIAIDFGGGAASASGVQYEWLVKHGAEYGWENPDWAKSSKYEPWHWEYVPARKTIKGH